MSTSVIRAMSSSIGMNLFSRMAAFVAEATIVTAAPAA
jgi:hypothetical protein